MTTSERLRQALKLLLDAENDAENGQGLAALITRAREATGEALREARYQTDRRT